MQRVGNVKRQQRRYAGTSCPCCMHPVIRLRSMRLCDTCHTLQPCCPTEGLQGLYDQDRIACCRSCWQACNNQLCRLQGRTILIYGACHVQQLLHRVQPLLNFLHAPESYGLGLEAWGAVGPQPQTLLEAASVGWLIERPQTLETAAGVELLAGANPVTCEDLCVRFRAAAPKGPFRDNGVGLAGGAQVQIHLRGWATQERSMRPPKAVRVWSSSHSREPRSEPSSLLRSTSSCLHGNQSHRS